MSAASNYVIREGILIKASPLLINYIKANIFH